MIRKVREGFQPVSAPLTRMIKLLHHPSLDTEKKCCGCCKRAAAVHCVSPNLWDSLRTEDICCYWTDSDGADNRSCSVSVVCL